ncbi:hypothetical protein B6S08_07385 [Oceanimonas doudoroffii]|uniref:Uncharacterized protein n=1 Tax=Oceanimonas doudoroffii TaxID=84158 RepID=A0A233RIT4_9GAMM|nr:hypothetical protein B6S08_07385 [Oceanimonas doudoroffii]
MGPIVIAALVIEGLTVEIQADVTAGQLADQAAQGQHNRYPGPRRYTVMMWCRVVVAFNHPHSLPRAVVLVLAVMAVGLVATFRPIVPAVFTIVPVRLVMRLQPVIVAAVVPIGLSRR